MRGCERRRNIEEVQTYKGGIFAISCTHSRFSAAMSTLSTAGARCSIVVTSHLNDRIF